MTLLAEGVVPVPALVACASAQPCVIGATGVAPHAVVLDQTQSCKALTTAAGPLGVEGAAHYTLPVEQVEVGNAVAGRAIPGGVLRAVRGAGVVALSDVVGCT